MNVHRQANVAGGDRNQTRRGGEKADATLSEGRVVRRVTSRGTVGTKAGVYERRFAALNNFNRDRTGATGTACDAAASSSERNGVGDRIGPPSCVVFERVSVARSQVENGTENGDTIRTISQRAEILFSTRCLPRSKTDAIAGPCPRARSLPPLSLFYGIRAPVKREGEIEQQTIRHVRCLTSQKRHDCCFPERV